MNPLRDSAPEGLAMVPPSDRVFGDTYNDLAQWVGLWATCERCGELEPADTFAIRAGAGAVCAGCDPGPTEAFGGSAVALEADGRWTVDLENGCGECEATVPCLVVMSAQEWDDNEPAWLRICLPCLLADRIGPFISAKTMGSVPPPESRSAAT